MFIDQQTLMSDSQVVTATANSTNLLDLRGSRNLGSGEPVKLLCQCKDGSTTAPTGFTAALVGADDSGFSTNKITIVTVGAGTGTPIATGATVMLRGGIPSHTPKRYYRVEYTVTGGSSPSVTVVAGIEKDEQTTPMV